MIGYIIRVESTTKGRSYIQLQSSSPNILKINPDATRSEAFEFKERFRAEALKVFFTPTDKDCQLFIDVIEIEDEKPDSLSGPRQA